MNRATMGALASMTGYGRAEARGSRLAVVVEVRSLNHRFLEVACKLPRPFGVQEPELRRLVQSRLSRGRVDVAVSLRRVGTGQASVRTDLALGASYLEAARTLARELGLAGGLEVADLLRLPGVVNLEEAEDADDEAWALLKEASEHALDELLRMRQAEGAALARDLAGHLDRLEVWACELDQLLPGALNRIRERLRARIEALLGEPPVDPGRLAQEAVVWAARSDVAEELARLRSHCERFRELLARGGAVGRQLDFLTQELHREVSTIASKVDDAALVARVLEGRTAVERLREQVQNIE